MNGPQGIHVNPDCFKCISDISLSLANKNMFAISFTLYFCKKAFNMDKSLRIVIFIPVKLLNTQTSWSLRNFDFLLLHTAYFVKSVILPFLVLKTL